jgi:hypothetical protein
MEELGLISRNKLVKMKKFDKLLPSLIIGLLAITEVVADDLGDSVSVRHEIHPPLPANSSQSHFQLTIRNSGESPILCATRTRDRLGMETRFGKRSGDIQA